MTRRRVDDVVAARRWLDTRRRVASDDSAGPDCSGTDGPSWQDQAASDDARVIGVALADQRRQGVARTWLVAVAQVAPARMLADVGGSLVDAAALTEAEAVLRRGAEAGDIESSLHLGRFLLFDRREEEAGQWLRWALETDPEAARFLLSDLRMRGADDVADRWAAMAAEMGDGAAAVQLARSAAQRGDDVEVERWFGWAERMGHRGVSMERLQVALERGDSDAVRRWLTVAADEGHPGAQRELGFGLLGDGDEAAGWARLRQAADGGDARAQLQLAARAGFEGDRAQLVHWMLTAARTDAAEASGFADTLLSAEQSELAAELLRACVEGGHDASRVPLGRLLVARGELDEAIEIVRPAAEAGLPEGGVLLGLAEEKRGRVDEARFAYLRAAAAGDGRASHKLGMLSSAAGDEAGAFQWFLEGARAGEASSLFNLAGMESDPRRSARWLVLAAAHGHPDAALRVGLMEFGQGRSAEGVRWLRRAVKLGEPQAAGALSAILAHLPALRERDESGGSHQ